MYLIRQKSFAWYIFTQIIEIHVSTWLFFLVLEVSWLMISTNVATGKRENRFCWVAEAQCLGRSSQEGSALDFTATLHSQDGFVPRYNWSFKLDIQHTFPIFVIILPKNRKFQIFCLFCLSRILNHPLYSPFFLISSESWSRIF